ncbi:MAG: type IV secretory system conjugative DNA transfer family protein [Minisyncoccia bacterium]
MVLYSISLPKYEEEENKVEGLKEKISQMEQVLAGFLSLKNSKIFKKSSSIPRVALEISSKRGERETVFYVAVPNYLENSFEKLIQGVYPKALVEKIPQDYTIFQPGGKNMGGILFLEKTHFLPLATYKTLEKDPISLITNAFDKIEEFQGAAIQIILKPTKSKFKSAGEKLIKNLKEGMDLNDAIFNIETPIIYKILNSILNFIFSIHKNKEEQKINEKEKKINEELISLIKNKIQKEVFEVNINIVVSAKTNSECQNILQGLVYAFSQFSIYGNNSFVFKNLTGKKLKKLIYDFAFRNFNKKHKIILNLEEIASIFHFPGSKLEIPYIKTHKVIETAPPIELPKSGELLLGITEFRGETKPVYFATKEDRRRHFYLVGQTGTGKSSLLREMIRQDIEQGRGVSVIDPHGELIEDTLCNVPQDRIDDVILFEPFDLERPIGLNMLEYDTPEQKDFAVQEMISIFYKLFPPEYMGPMFEHYMRNAMLAIMADRENPGTLVEIPRIFTDESFMEWKLQKVADPLVRNFWLREWKQTTGQTRSDMLGYVVSKIGRFIENEMMRNIIGQSKSGINFEEVINTKKIFLANLSKGLTGEVNSALLGLILVGKIQMAAMKRAKIPEQEREDFYLYIDEFQNFTTDSIVTILSEARKYHLNLILAHQYIPQLRQEIKDAVLGNVGTIGAFRIGAEDAEFLEKQFKPEFSKFDLLNLDNFNLIIKMLINNKVSSAFKMKTIKPIEGNKEMVNSIKQISKLKYGKASKRVEKEIIERSHLFD